MNETKEINPSKKIKGMLFYNVKDLMVILGLGKLTVRRYLKSGKIPGGLKIGNRYYISSRNLDRWLGKGSIFSKPEKYVVDLINEELEKSNEKVLEKVNEVFNETFRPLINKINKKIETLEYIGGG
jgi:Pyruvate/2-oxoacid:ferredoxin oxidoreductase gamma subunit